VDWPVQKSKQKNKKKCDVTVRGGNGIWEGGQGKKAHPGVGFKAEGVWTC